MATSLLMGWGPFEVRSIFSPIKKEEPFWGEVFGDEVFSGELVFNFLLLSIFEILGVEYSRSFIFPKLRVVFSGLESRRPCPRVYLQGRGSEGRSALSHLG